MAIIADGFFPLLIFCFQILRGLSLNMAILVKSAKF